MTVTPMRSMSSVEQVSAEASIPFARLSDRVQRSTGVPMETRMEMQNTDRLPVRETDSRGQDKMLITEDMYR